MTSASPGKSPCQAQLLNHLTGLQTGSFQKASKSDQRTSQLKAERQPPQRQCKDQRPEHGSKTWPQDLPLPSTPVSSQQAPAAAGQLLQLSDLAHLFLLSNTPLCITCLLYQRAKQDLESHQDCLSHEGTKDNGPCLANGSFANWLFGATQKTFTARSNDLNSRVVVMWSYSEEGEVSGRGSRAHFSL